MKKRVWLSLLLLIPIGFGLSRIRFDPEVLNLMPAELPAVQGIKTYQRNFSNARELILTLEAGDADLAETSARSLAETLRKQSDLVTDVFWQPPWLERPDLSAELIAFLWLNQPAEKVDQLIRGLEPGAAREKLQQVREELTTSLSPTDIARRSYDPFGLTDLPPDPGMRGVSFGEGQELFASEDGTFRLLFLKSKDDLANYKECDAFVKRIDAVVNEWKKTLGSESASVTVQYTGRPAFVAEIATGMERDFMGPSAGTILFIAFLFYVVHRRWLPLFWLITLLALTLVFTLALGGFVFGLLNVVSLGFASILLGLGEDFGIVLYQESQTHPNHTAAEIRKAAAPGIFWSAVTTSGAFLVLNLGGLPGLGQLGTLVAIGIMLAAFLMLYLYLPPLLRRESERKRRDRLVDGILPNGAGRPGSPHSATLHHLEGSGGILPPTGSGRPASIPLPPWHIAFAWLATLLVLLGGAIFLTRGPVPFDPSPDSLKPKSSVAYAALEKIKLRMKQQREPLWILVSGKTEQEVAAQLKLTQPILQKALEKRQITGFTLPAAMWPNPDRQLENRQKLAQLADKKSALVILAEEEGFTTNSIAMTKTIFDQWQSQAMSLGTTWPTNSNSRWILNQFTSRKEGDYLALGLVYPPERPTAVPEWANQLPSGAILSGWELIGPGISKIVLSRLPMVLSLIFVIVSISLWLAYRSFRDVFLCLALIGFSALLLGMIMALFGWSWNMLNLMALPLLLGLGIDYGIHIQLALRRYSGNLGQVHASIGKALLLAGTTTIAGFASLAFSSNAGLASLGKVAALGIGCALLTAVYLLPIWWKRTHAHFDRSQLSPLSRPSALYRSWFWQLALNVTRRIPESTLIGWCERMSVFYWFVAYSRRRIVVENLLPVVKGDRREAEKKAKQLFKNFGRKLAHLWRYECGMPIDHLFGPLLGEVEFKKAQTSGRGVLLLTPHLGNWEFGAPILAKLGIKLLVITLFEPNDRLTEMRQESRARWGIETLVIGKDPFAFVEVISRLEDGAMVALLVDRPPTSSSARVELLGHPFAASISPAELARATGCVLLPVLLPCNDGIYSALVLPEIPYDRAALRKENRGRLAQEIMRVFEPQIVHYADQWYHFVPVWPDEAKQIK